MKVIESGYEYCFGVVHSDKSVYVYSEDGTIERFVGTTDEALLPLYLQREFSRVNSIAKENILKKSAV